MQARLDFKRVDFQAERAGRRLDLTQLQHGERIADIAHDRETAQTGDDLTQKLEPLTSKIGPQGCEAGDVAPGPRETCDQACPDGVARQRKDDGEPLSLPLPQ